MSLEGAVFARGRNTPPHNYRNYWGSSGAYHAIFDVFFCVLSTENLIRGLNFVGYRYVVGFPGVDLISDLVGAFE